MNVQDFPLSYRLQMIRAYPVIAQMDADEEYFATPDERDEAFGRILANKNLRRTHEMFLEDRVAQAALEVYTDHGVRVWMKSKNKALDDRSPEELVRAGDFQRVLDYIDFLAEGNFA